MTSRRTLKRTDRETVAYKDRMFEALDSARSPAAVLWTYGYNAFLSALKEVVKSETWQKGGGRVEPEKPAGMEVESTATPSGWKWCSPVDEEVDLKHYLSEDFVQYAFGELDNRQRCVIFFLLNEVGLNDLRLKAERLVNLTGTARHQALYETKTQLSSCLTNLLRVRLAGEKRKVSDVDAWEVAILSKMLLPRLAAKCSEWAKENGLWDALFLPENK